jgi:hypothetical protein
MVSITALNVGVVAAALNRAGQDIEAELASRHPNVGDSLFSTGVGENQGGKEGGDDECGVHFD